MMATISEKMNNKPWLIKVHGKTISCNTKQMMLEIVDKDRQFRLLARC